jgi:hypothetical protein
MSPVPQESKPGWLARFWMRRARASRRTGKGVTLARLHSGHRARSRSRSHVHLMEMAWTASARAVAPLLVMISVFNATEAPTRLSARIPAEVMVARDNERRSPLPPPSPAGHSSFGAPRAVGATRQCRSQARGPPPCLAFYETTPSFPKPGARSL